MKGNQFALLEFDNQTFMTLISSNFSTPVSLRKVSSGGNKNCGHFQGSSFTLRKPICMILLARWRISERSNLQELTRSISSCMLLYFSSTFESQVRFSIVHALSTANDNLLNHSRHLRVSLWPSSSSRQRTLLGTVLSKCLKTHTRHNSTLSKGRRGSCISEFWNRFGKYVRFV